MDTDSAPCSPRKPNPTCHSFAQGIISSPNRCISVNGGIGKRSSEVSRELWYCSGLVEASLFRTLDAIFTSILVGSGLMCILVTCPNVPLAPHTFHHYDMSFNNVCIKGGAGLSCCGFICDSMKQQGHFTSLQLKSRPMD